MSIARKTSVEGIESSFAILPEVPGRAEFLKIPGSEGFVTPLSHPMANMIVKDTLDSDNADDAIKEVCAFFSMECKAFSW